MTESEPSYIEPNHWSELARCSDPDVDERLFFPGLQLVDDPEDAERRAKAICNNECLVREVCLESALIHGYLDIRGGTNENERKIIARDRKRQAGEGIYGLRLVGRLARRFL